MSVRIDVHHHGLGHPDVIEQHLKLIYDRVVGLGLQGAQIMATQAEMQADLAEANAATNEIASDVDELLTKVMAGGMTAAEEDAVKSQIAALTGRLKGVAAKYTADPPLPPVPA